MLLGECWTRRWPRSKLWGMRPTISLVVLLAACGPKTEDPLDDSLPASDSSGSDEGAGTNVAQSSSEGTEGGSSDASDLPPSCVEEGLCAVLEAAVAIEACDYAGFTIEAVETLWYASDEIRSHTTPGECAFPARTEVDSAQVWSLRLAVVYSDGEATWRCTLDEGIGGGRAVELGESVSVPVQASQIPYPYENNLDPQPPEMMTKGYGCCLVTGEPGDANMVETPC